MKRMLEHFAGCDFFDAAGAPLTLEQIGERLGQFRVRVRDPYAGEEGWRKADLRENPGDFYLFFVGARPDVLARYGRTLVEERALAPAPHQVRRSRSACDRGRVRARRCGRAAPPPTPVAPATAGKKGKGKKKAKEKELPPPPPPVVAPAEGRMQELIDDVRARSTSRHSPTCSIRATTGRAPATRAGRQVRGQAPRLRGVDGRGPRGDQDLGLDPRHPRVLRLRSVLGRLPGREAKNGVEVTVKGQTFITTALHAHVWGMHHRYPTNSPAIDAEGRGNPAGAHPFKAYNVLLMHNGEQVGVDSTSPFLNEFGYVHADESMGRGLERTTTAIRSTSARRSPTPSTPPTWSTSRGRVLGLTTEEREPDHLADHRHSTSRTWMTSGASSSRC